MLDQHSTEPFKLTRERNEGKPAGPGASAGGSCCGNRLSPVAAPHDRPPSHAHCHRP